MNDLETLRNQLLTNRTARARFLADTLDLLKKNGVDVDDPTVLDSLALEFDLKDGKKFVDGLSASTVVVTVVM